MSIKAKLVVLLLIPTLAFLWFASASFRNAQESATESTKISSLSELATTLSSFVHESQKERGYTGGFMGSKGKKLGSELRAQRLDSDQKLAAVQRFFDANPINELPVDIQSALKHAFTFSDRIDSMRSQMLSLSIEGKVAIGYYSAMNTAFIDAIGQIGYESTDDLLTRELVAYTNFLKSKERAGQERAVISNTFALDAFPSGMYAKFITIVGAQGNYMDAFLTTCSPESRAAYEQVLSDPTFAQVEDYRKVIHANALTGGFGKDSGTWIKVSTARINKLKEAEDGLSEIILNRAKLIQSRATANMRFIGLSALITFGTTVFFGWFIMIKMVIKPIGLLCDRLKDIAEGEGDLTIRVDESRRDELGELGKWFNVFIANLNSIISKMRDVSEVVSSGSAEISASVEEMASGLQTQEQQTQQVAAAVEELSQSVNEVAGKSVDASTASKDSQHQAEEGGNIVASTVEEMKGIAIEVQGSAETINTLGEKSETIGEIIAVINDIADQTNLLALNAAIEAARAGEHGRGFAVVADEVRKLAERTTIATEEVSVSIRGIQSETSSAVQMIETGSDRVRKGVDLATQAGVALGSIVGGSQSVQSMVQDIAAAANQQSSATGEIAQAIESINTVTRESSQNASQAAQTAGGLAVQAEQLQRLVTQFKIE